RPDRVGEFFQRFLIHVAARLVFAALNEFDRQLSQLTVLAGGSGSAVGSARSIAGRVIRRDLFGGGMAAEQRIEPASESPFFHGFICRLSQFVRKIRQFISAIQWGAALRASLRRSISPASARYASAPFDCLS